MLALRKKEKCRVSKAERENRNLATNPDCTSICAYRVRSVQYNLRPPLLRRCCNLEVSILTLELITRRTHEDTCGFGQRRLHKVESVFLELNYAT